MFVGERCVRRLACSRKENIRLSGFGGSLLMGGER